MPTRRIWNEHAYHVTNIKVDATLPSPEANSWGPSGFNDYRVSVQGNETSLAPDLIVNLSASFASCPTSLVLDVAVANLGSIGVPAGVIVQFFAGGLSGTVIGQATTTVPLAPGQSQVLTLTVPATATATSYAAAVNQVPPVTPECDTSNDTSTLSGVQCETPQYPRAARLRGIAMTAAVPRSVSGRPMRQLGVSKRRRSRRDLSR